MTTTKWDKIAQTWSDMGPPASPSNDDLDALKTAIASGLSGKDRPKLAILGVTPKIREMLAVTQISDLQVYLIDNSEPMVEASLAAVPLYRCETIMPMNWLNIGSELAGEFDMIVGDKFLDNVPYTEWHALIHSLSNATTEAAELAFRVGFQDESFSSFSLSQSIEKWSNVALKEGDQDRALVGFWEELLGASAYRPNHSNRTSVQSISKFDSELKFDLYSERHRNFLQRFIAQFADTFPHEWTSYTKSDLERSLLPLFEIKGLHYSSDYPAADRQPIVSCRKPC